jgi:hypothetical protein
MQGVDMRGMASWIVMFGIGVTATGCPLTGKGGTGPGNGSNGVVIPAGLPKLVDLDKLRLTQRDALPFEGLVPRNFCFAPPPVDPATIDVDRSLFVHDRATLDAVDFSLKRTLGKIASDAVAAGATGATGAALFRDLWDTQSPHASAATPTGAQCDDAGTTLNGFPNACRTIDGAQAKAANLDAEMATYHAVGIVNRLDLAAEGWKNCGEHRIVYGRQGAGVQRSFIIFEAVLPNPRPGCESGCRAVAEHWYQLSSVADPVERAKRLEQLFYTGLPGYEPVVRLDHYAAKTTGGYSGGSGQIRTNQFLESPWMLKEFKLALDCTIKPCVVEPVPIPVKVNPDGELWRESTLGLANEFQQNVVLPQVSSLGLNDITKFSYQVALQFDAARSQPQSPGLHDHYFEAYTAVPGVPGGFRSALGTAAAATSPVLTDKQVVNRALALSCAGCHMPSSFNLTLANSIGPGMSWPDSAGFVHVRAEAVSGVHALSSALTSTFLPARAKNLASMLSDDVCFCRFRKVPIDTSRFEQVAFARPPATLADIRTAEDSLKRQIDTALTRENLPRLPDLAPETVSTGLVLDEVKAAGSELRARSTALRAAVQKLVTSEPPRKTVTGHFRAE